MSVRKFHGNPYNCCWLANQPQNACGFDVIYVMVSVLNKNALQQFYNSLSLLSLCETLASVDMEA